VTGRAWTALWTVYIVWGSTYLGIKLAGETIPSFFAVSTRFLLAGAVLATWVAWRRGIASFRVTRVELASAALVGLLLPGANALLVVAEHDVPTGLASLIIAAVPLIVVCLRVAGGDRPPRAAVIGVLVGFAGIALLLDPEGGATWGGIALVGGSALAWALGSYLSARLPMPRDVLAATSYEMLAGGLILLPFGLAESPDPSSFSATSIIAFFYLVAFGSLIGFTAYIWLLANVPLGTVSTYAYVNPVVAIALGVLFLDEVVTWRIAAGALIVLASVAVVVRRESEAAVEPFAE
jgi:drug/metabolite transporter (DMT)-like permease